MSSMRYGRLVAERREDQLIRCRTHAEPATRSPGGSHPRAPLSTLRHFSSWKGSQRDAPDPSELSARIAQLEDKLTTKQLADRVHELEQHLKHTKQEDSAPPTG